MRASINFRTLTVRVSDQPTIKPKHKSKPKTERKQTTKNKVITKTGAVQINGSIIAFLKNDKLLKPVLPLPPPPPIIQNDYSTTQKQLPQVTIKPSLNVQEVTTKQIERDELWTEIYRPKRSKDLLGNHTALNQIRNWLQAKWVYNPDAARALLIHGPPGVGKTTSAQLLSIERGFDVCEINASDERSAEQLHLKVGVFIDRKTLFKRVAFILDEVDGGETEWDNEKIKETSKQKQNQIEKEEKNQNGDKKSNESKRNKQSGLAYLRELVSTKLNKLSCPLIFICNSLKDKSIRELKEVCEVVRFYPIDDSNLLSYARRICASENIQMKQEESLKMVTFARGDARRIASFLQLFSSTTTNSGTISDFGEISSSDGLNNIFDHMQSLFFIKRAKNIIKGEEERLLLEALSLWSSEPQLYNAMIFENYLKFLEFIQIEFDTFVNHKTPSNDYRMRLKTFRSQFCNIIDSLANYDSISTQYWHPDQFELLETVSHVTILGIRQLTTCRLDLVQSIGYYATAHPGGYNPKYDSRKKIEFPKVFTTKKNVGKLVQAKKKIVQMFRKDASTLNDIDYYLQVLHDKLSKSVGLFNADILNEEAQEIVQHFFDAGIHPEENKDFKTLGWMTQSNKSIWKRIEIELIQKEKQNGYIICEKNNDRNKQE